MPVLKDSLDREGIECVEINIETPGAMDFPSDSAEQKAAVAQLISSLAPR
jgi:hypothetical protein